MATCAAAPGIRGAARQPLPLCSLTCSGKWGQRHDDPAGKIPRVLIHLQVGAGKGSRAGCLDCCMQERRTRHLALVNAGGTIRGVVESARRRRRGAAAAAATHALKAQWDEHRHTCSSCAAASAMGTSSCKHETAWGQNPEGGRSAGLLPYPHGGQALAVCRLSRPRRAWSRAGLRPAWLRVQQAGCLGGSWEARDGGSGEGRAFDLSCGAFACREER